MKPKEYVKKYNLDQPTAYFDHKALVSDLTMDFVGTVEFLNSGGQLNYERFKTCIKEIRQKFDSISNKSGGKLKEELWNYFYATSIVKIRDSMFGDYLKQKKDSYEKKKSERAAWNNHAFGFGGFFDFTDLLKALLSTRLYAEPTCFKILGIDKTATKDQVMKSFREMSLIYHPDKGGSEEKMMEIIRAKNECLSYI